MNYETKGVNLKDGYICKVKCSVLLLYVFLNWEAALGELVEQNFLHSEVLRFKPHLMKFYQYGKKKWSLARIKIVQKIEQELYLICMGNTSIVKDTILLYANISCS
jgi:hypothetical protein